MNQNKLIKDSIILEPHDIIDLAKIFPDYEIGVRINAIYAQVAKFSGNPNRNRELQIFSYALERVEADTLRRFKYTTMTLQDVIKCFGNRLPQGAFIQSVPLENPVLAKVIE